MIQIVTNNKAKFQNGYKSRKVHGYTVYKKLKSKFRSSGYKWWCYNVNKSQAIPYTGPEGLESTTVD